MKTELIKSDVEIKNKGKDFVRINYIKSGLQVNISKKDFEKNYVIIEKRIEKKEPKAKDSK